MSVHCSICGSETPGEANAKVVLCSPCADQLIHKSGAHAIQLKQLEAALRESDEKFHALTSHSLLGIVLIQQDKVVYINSAQSIMSGFSAEEYLTLPVAHFFSRVHPDDRARAIERQQRFMRGELFEEMVELRVQAKDGSWHWIISLAKTLTMQGKPARLWMSIDITDRKQAEEERGKLQSQLLQAQKLESMGILAGGIAHDFNNLLTSILGYSDLALLQLPNSSPARPMINAAVNGARRAAELTQQMLAYSGKGRFVVEPINLSTLVEDMARLLQITISKKCVLKYDLAKDLPAVEADAVQMRQIIMNLIINASEAIGERSGVIAVSTGVMHCDRAYLAETYLIENLAEGLYVHLEVADNGPGMTEEVRAKIFDPFFTTKFTGSGLGLAAVLGIVRGHKGALKCYSEVGKGTTFKILFPASTLPPKLLEHRADTPEWRSSGTVLVVDDEEMVRALAKSMLELMGFTVRLAVDGREGVEIFRQAPEQIRLVLLDMTMPHLDGAEAFREMRRIRGDVRVILSSGFNEQSATSSFAGKGLAAFIQKPYRFNDLQTVVRKSLDEHGGSTV